MLTAFIMIKTDRRRLHDVAQDILRIEGIMEVYSVAGEYDLVAVARTRENDNLSKLVTEDMVGVDGIADTTTMIAFRQYSEHDLESMFGRESLRETLAERHRETGAGVYEPVF
ncbi:MAG: Lrp/AsnC family transcriptional regulator [Phycisphaerae bacterium]